jgi:hypothetical protein
MAKENLEKKADEFPMFKLTANVAKYVTFPIIAAAGATYLIFPEYRTIAGYAALASLVPPLVCGGVELLVGAAEAFSSACDIDIGL